MLICFLAQQIKSSLEILNSALNPTRKISGLILLIWRMIFVVGFKLRNRELEESNFLSNLSINSKSETAAVAH